MAHLLPAGRRPADAGRAGGLAAALEQPERPVAAIVGGAKISTKLDLLGNLVARVDMLVIGGGMANTFLHAVGVEVGKSLCEHDMADTAREISRRPRRRLRRRAADRRGGRGRVQGRARERDRARSTRCRPTR
jgi:phosphoglycerate kinase